MRSMRRLLSLLRLPNAPTYVVVGFDLGSDMPGRLLHICVWTAGAPKHGLGGCTGFPRNQAFIIRAFIVTALELFLPCSVFQSYARSRCAVVTSPPVGWPGTGNHAIPSVVHNVRRRYFGNSQPAVHCFVKSSRGAFMAFGGGVVSSRWGGGLVLHVDLLSMLNTFA